MREAGFPRENKLFLPNRLACLIACSQSCYQVLLAPTLASYLCCSRVLTVLRRQFPVLLAPAYGEAAAVAGQPKLAIRVQS